MNALENMFRIIDACNAADPAGQEEIYGRRMSEMQEKFAPDASEVLKIAIRGQHVERWTLARADYPEGRIGYLRWRTDQKHRHAEKLAELMQNQAYAPEAIARVGALVRKERLRQDQEAQCLEDVACLVFLQFYAADFIGKHTEDKVLDIIRKTWEKMSAEGRSAALKLALPAGLAVSIARALS